MNSFHTSPSDVVDAAYSLLSFTPGSTPCWPEFQALFVDTAVLGLRVFPSDAQVSVLSLQQYGAAQMQHGLKEQGYSEIPGERTIKVVGDVATVEQAFTMNFADGVPVSAVDFFSLVRTQDRWRIVSVISDTLADR